MQLAGVANEEALFEIEELLVCGEEEDHEFAKEVLSKQNFPVQSPKAAKTLTRNFHQHRLCNWRLCWRLKSFLLR